MKRLTEQLGNGCVTLKRGVLPENMQEALGVLADYEDAGLTPDEITALQAENAALKARLEKSVELPCKKGDAVYWIENGISIKKAVNSAMRMLMYG